MKSAVETLSPSRVKLGIQAPASVVVLRKEVQVTGEANREASRFEAGELARQSLPVLVDKPGQ